MVDDEDRENEGDLIFAAELATPELVSFMVRYTSGYICVPLTEAECDRLDLPPMHHINHDRYGTAFTVPVDARDGIGTGISATDRAHTIRVLADPESGPADLARPGHVLPLRAREGGVLRRPGHTEAAVDLARLAGLKPGRRDLRDRLAEGRRRHGRGRRAAVFADEHELSLITIKDLIAYRRRSEKQVVQVAHANIPTDHGEFVAYGYDSLLDGIEHVALVHGDDSATARTSWSACTPSASPATSWAPGAATAAPSSTPRWPRWPPRAAGSCSTCAATRAGGSA